MAKPRKKRQRYTDAQRKRILTAAQKGNLTANQVKQRFGVTPVTYYSWRKKAKMPAMPRGRRPGSGFRNGGHLALQSLESDQRIRSQIRARLDAIVRDEARRTLKQLQ
jgi:transposase-like protein